MAHNAHPPLSPKDLEEAFIKVTFEEDVAHQDAAAGDPMYDPWVDQASNKFSDPAVFGARQLRKLYPDHSIVLSFDYTVNIFGYPGALIQPLSPPDLISAVYFVPLARRLSQIPGVLVDSISFGSFRVAWDKYDFLLYVVKYPFGFGQQIQHYIIHNGPEEPARALLVAAGGWNAQLHNEILVFNSGFWQKDHRLWTEIQKANWADVILNEDFKANLKKDIYGFFDSEKLYKSLSIPWKRGLIMHGPPGNGKTISMKAVMKDCDAQGYSPLYVKSFKSWAGEEAAMQMVFDKAREMAPCVLILEDLDSLINNANRSFFLNQLDGFDGNDGLLLIGSTNHLDQLDPALNNRPSRFDRKFFFDDPTEEERTLYVQYWQDKLKSNDSISFPDDLVEEVASGTDGFSFAYLKEAFVSSLVLLAGYETDDKPEFRDVLLDQIKKLRKQLDKSKDTLVPPQAISVGVASATAQSNGAPRMQIDQRVIGQHRIWDAAPGPVGRMPGALPAGPSQQPSPSARARTMAGNVVHALGKSFIS
ncbi:P-loop containing nucleoside triphosphate hydrolase protein [Lentinus tigrinus ALCF2SS1-7]|uniref:P-loop containing nucleoside triphosphate hydrolase protein n=1 Tax=Lentinus tigrinus ALCF2SS1-6 TaxID=1328759 RepID=A0A5C2SUK8_9APHY|nr:P-loop containing nucleoside triphosphate hydrolase protein [Lentinus tigrinus ALCF2SS1-6]RPD80683.1 P-loop containing nucleoside triphosphate hydrolase protein [Lentinus tigrinus ALCF2SS1-7]